MPNSWYAYVKEQRRSCPTKYNFDIEVKARSYKLMNVRDTSYMYHGDTLAKHSMTMSKDKKAVARTQKPC